MSADCSAHTISGIHHFFLLLLSSCHFQAPFSKTKPSAFISGWHNVNGWVVLWWVIKRWELFDSQSESSKTDTASIASTSASASTINCCGAAELRWGQQAPAVYTDAESEDQREDARQSEALTWKLVEFAAELASELDPIRAAAGFSWWWWERFLINFPKPFLIYFWSSFRRNAIDHNSICHPEGELNTGNHNEKNSNKAADWKDQNGSWMRFIASNLPLLAHNLIKRIFLVFPFLFNGN